MADPFVAEIRIFTGNFAPTGWATCDGQILSISQNTALFSLLGTTYGGNGQSTFALPNLAGSTPVGQGAGAGLNQRFLGESSGSPNVTLLISEIPLHSHSVSAYTGDAADSRTPNPTSSLGLPSPGKLYDATATQLTAMAPQAFTPTGGGQPHNNMPPYLTVFFIIALQGIFPPRS